MSAHRPGDGEEGEIKLLHIAGLHSTGSTILANVLGEVEGFFAAGELAYLWQVLAPGRVCGCGVAVTECEVWRPVLDSVFEGPEEAIERLRPQAAWLKALDLHLLALQERRGDLRLERYRSMLGDLFRALRITTGARVIVETSKHPPYGRVLGGVPGVQAYVVHLVRDPRATTYSWLRRNRWNGAGVGAIWTSWHWAIPHLWRHRRDKYLSLRYEDFVRSPRQAVLDILTLVGEPAGELPFVDEHTVRLRPNHMPNGNPSRFRIGLVELKADEEWRTRLGRRQALATTATAWPLLHRWGYPLVRNGASSR